LGALYYYFKSKEALLDARIDEEIQPLRIAVRTPASRSTRLDTVYAVLVDGLNTELAEWITAWASPLPRQECVDLAAVGVNNILGIRFTTSFVPPVRSTGV
jgi:AcrR family transcriptional regulator